VNPASVKQSLVSTATLLPTLNIFEQGAGRLDLLRAVEFAQAYTPRVTLFPEAIDFTECPYLWPYCDQPLFATAMPLVVNVTVLNGIGVSSRIVGPARWISIDSGDMLEVHARGSEQVWPWVGWLAVSVEVSQTAQEVGWTGVASGQLVLTVVTDSPVRVCCCCNVAFMSQPPPPPPPPLPPPPPPPPPSQPLFCVRDFEFHSRTSAHPLVFESCSR
jgi:membrane-bound transcription factor site-1 protease